MSSPEFPDPNEMPESTGDSFPSGEQFEQPLPKGLAIASMVLGIVGIVTSLCCGCLVPLPVGAPLGIVAVILGFIANSHANQGKAGGKGMALAGIICGFIAIALAILFLILFYFVGATANLMQMEHKL